MDHVLLWPRAGGREKGDLPMEVDDGVEMMEVDDGVEMMDVDAAAKVRFTFNWEVIC